MKSRDSQAAPQPLHWRVIDTATEETLGFPTKLVRVRRLEDDDERDCNILTKEEDEMRIRAQIVATTTTTTAAKNTLNHSSRKQERPPPASGLEEEDEEVLPEGAGAGGGGAAAVGGFSVVVRRGDFVLNGRACRTTAFGSTAISTCRRGMRATLPGEAFSKALAESTPGCSATSDQSWRGPLQLVSVVGSLNCANLKEPQGAGGGAR